MGVTELRPRRGPRTAFVLGGGGNLGAVQVGMLRALFERGMTPDLIVGCSVGAVNGAAIALEPGLDGVATLDRTWRDPATWSVFGTRVTPLALFRRATSMVGSEKLESMLRGQLGTLRLDELAVPLHVVATSLRTGRERWLSTGPAVPAVLASSALPAVLPPVEHERRRPHRRRRRRQRARAKAVELGAERVVVLHVGNLSKPRPMPRRPIDVLLQSFSIARNHRFAMERDDVGEGVELIVLPGVDPGSLKRNDFSRSSELMTRAHASSAAFLDALPLAAGALDRLPSPAVRARLGVLVALLRGRRHRRRAPRRR